MRFIHPFRIIVICGQFFIGSEAYSRLAPDALKQSTRLEIPFYLPINQQQFPGLFEELQSELTHASIANPLLSSLKLTATDYWHPYQQGIRQGRRGIYFAAPHFVSWLIDQHRFEPTLKLSGNLQYAIAVRQADSHIFEVRDLANKKVCANATMDLSFLLVRNSMRRSLLPAKILHVEAVDKEMKKNNKRCDAFSLSEHLFLEFSTRDPFQYIRLKQSEKFSNYAYVIHPSISSATKRALRKFIVSKRVIEILQPMYRLFAKEPVILGAKTSNYPPSQMQLLLPYWRSESRLLKAP